MKVKKFLCLFLFIAFSTVTFAQSVVVTPEVITYTRHPEPDFDPKKTFTVTYPKIRAENAVLSKKIETAIRYSIDIQDEMRGGSLWLDEASYEIIYNKNGVLCISLTTSGTGSYSSSVTEFVVVDLKTGNRVEPVDVFKNLDELAAKVKRVQRTEVGQAVKKIKKEGFAEDRGSVEDWYEFKMADFKVSNLAGFSINGDGVTFHYDYGFIHAMKSFQSDGNYFLNWREIGPFIQPAGLLARFVH